MKGTLVSSEFWKMIGGKMLEGSNTRVHTAEKGGKGLRVLGKEERIKFYLDGLDRRFEVEPIVKSRKVDEVLQCIQETFPFHD